MSATSIRSTALANSNLTILILVMLGLRQVQLAAETGQRGHQLLAVIILTIATLIAVRKLRHKAAADAVRARFTAALCADPVVWRHPAGWTVTLVEGARGTHARVEGPTDLEFHFPLPPRGHERCVINLLREHHAHATGLARRAVDVAIAYLEHLAASTPQETHR